MVSTMTDEANWASPTLLRKIDQLREKNVGQHVPLPQVRFQSGYFALAESVSSYSLLLSAIKALGDFLF